MRRSPPPLAPAALLLSLSLSACGADPAAHPDGGADDDDPAEADAGDLADAGPQVEAVIEHSHSICGEIDGYRARDYDGWDPGRTFAVALPAATTTFRARGIDYALQRNAGGSAPVGLAHRAWLFVGPPGGPPAADPVASWDVPAGPELDAYDRRVRLELAAGEPSVVIAAGQAPYVVIDVTPPGVDFESLVIEQCWIGELPGYDHVFYAPEVDPPYTWAVEQPYFQNYVPDVRVFGSVDAGG